MKNTIAEHFAEADVAESRFINVNEGEKGTYDHDTRYDDPRDAPGQNYGIYCAEDDQLVVLDVDVHRGGDEDYDEKALVSLTKLDMTLRVQSPHADEGVGGHRIYKLTGDETPAELFDRVFGRNNPVPSWGEVVSKNKYVVGPGSQLDGCDKDWCDECATADGGRYTVDDDREIATVTPDDLIDALAADADLERIDTADDGDVTDYEGSETSTNPTRHQENSPESDDDLTREQVEELLDALPGDQHFDDWIRTGYAVFNWDSTDTGKEVFKEWSEDNEDWEKEQSQYQIDYIWDKGETGEPGVEDGRVTTRTLVKQAREEGYDGELGGAPDEDNAADWRDVRAVYEYAQSEPEYPKGHGRMAAADVLERETSFMYVVQSEILWVYDDESGVYGRYGRKHVANRLERKLNEHYSSNEVREIISRLEARNQVRRSRINARGHDDPLVCVGNGVVNLRTGELLDHDPGYRFVRGLDVDYKPDAADPEKITAFLDDVTEREADRDTLLDHLAHGLMPGHPYRAFVVCYGPGGNGKTQVSELFRGFVGREQAAAVEIDELAGGDFATGDLPGTFLNWGDDMAGDGGGQLSDLSLLKKATGGSEIRANEKYEKTFNFKNEAAMFFSANEPPRIGEQKNSIADRIYPIEMPYEFKTNPDPENPLEKQKTPKISDTLLEDDAAMRGLLELAVEHAEGLIANKGEYSQPESPRERLQKYNESADPIVNFAKRMVCEADADTLIRKDDAYRIYQSVTDAQDERAASERGFKRQLPPSIPHDTEDARSRSLATADDESDRVRCWKRVGWTETAKAYMPDWMRERYADHFDSVESDESATDTAEKAENGDATPGLKQLDPGRHTLEVTLAEVKEPKPYLQGEGVLVDDGELIDYVVDGSTDPFTTAEEGDRVRITNAKVATDRDGLLRVEISDVCDVEVLASVDADQTSVDAAADGGSEQADTAADESDESDADGTPTQRVKDLLRDEYGPHADVSVAAVAGALNMDPDTAATALDAVANRSSVLKRTPERDEINYERGS